jgi:hypothetical protein
MSELEFVPFDDPWPTEGEHVELIVPNPNFAAELEAYRAVLERNPFAEGPPPQGQPPAFDDDPESIVGADEICVSTQRLTVVVGYPFSGQWAVVVEASTSRGFTFAGLYRELVRIYTAMYEGSTARPMEHLDNMHVESPRFGTSWHELRDLVIEGILLTRARESTFAWIYIGS